MFSTIPLENYCYNADPYQEVVMREVGEYPEDLETVRTTQSGLEIFLRPVKLSDASHLSVFFNSLSDQSFHRRFNSERKDWSPERIQKFTVVDYSKEMFILALIKGDFKEKIVGLGQYWIDELNHTADVALLVGDNHQNKGIGTELLRYLTTIAKTRGGILTINAEVLMGNDPMLHICEKAGIDKINRMERGLYEIIWSFNAD